MNKCDSYPCYEEDVAKLVNLDQSVHNMIATVEKVVENYETLTLSDAYKLREFIKMAERFVEFSIDAMEFEARTNSRDLHKQVYFERLREELKAHDRECEQTQDGERRIMFDFGTALKFLKEGKRVARNGWNGKNQYVELATNIGYKNADGEIINPDHSAIGNKCLAFVGTSGVQLGWLASQSDMLAEDWFLKNNV